MDKRDQEIYDTFAEADNTVAMFTREDGAFGLVSKFDSIVGDLYYACPFARPMIEDRHFKTERGAVEYMKRNGFKIA